MLAFCCSHVVAQLSRFRKDERGVTAIEYALLAAGIAVVVGTAASTLGGKISTQFGTIGTAISG